MSTNPQSKPAGAPVTAEGGLVQAPSAYRYRVGEIVVTAVHEGFNAMALKEGFVTNASLAEVQEALGEAFMPTDTLPITFTPLVVQTGDETILIDTGFADNGPPSAGFARRNMAAAGIQPEAITKVVISHFHGDHINGLRSKAGEDLYPNAEILVPEAEWEFWTDDNRRAQAPDAMKANFDNVARIFGPMGDRVGRYRWDQEVAPGITAIDARGHTPGHTAYSIASGSDRLMMISDVTNHPALFVRHPDWSAAFDIDAEQARATRRRILDMAAQERMQIAGYHFPFPATGHVERDGDGFRYWPAQWMMVV